MPKGDGNRKFSTARVDEVVRRYTTRLPDGTWEGTTALAREFGVTHPTIRRWLRLRGVETRSHKEAHSGGKRCKTVRSLPPGASSADVPSGPCPLLMAFPGAPACKCGCGGSVMWNRHKNRWNAYVVGHYRRTAPYKDQAWLVAEYVGKRRSVSDIAAECGVGEKAVARFMDKFGIPRRDASEAHIGILIGPRNPSWKGGVAQWPYASGWKVIARRVRERDQWTCQDCGERRKRWGIHLHVHHVDGDKLNNDPVNLISLCAACHNARHRVSPPALGPVREEPAA